MSTILTNLTQHYQTATQGWFHYLFPVAQHLFAVLAVIEIAWSGLLIAMEEQEFSSLWVNFLKKMIMLGFCYTLLQYAPTWIPGIIKSFMMIGAGASHINGLYPSDILDQGISVATAIMQPLLEGGLLHAGLGLIIGGVTSLVVILSFALIAAELIVSLIESYLIIGAGILLLGFSSNRFTSKLSNQYLSYAISIGVKLFILYLMIGVGSTLATNWGQLVVEGGVKNIAPFLEVMAGSLVFYYIVRTIPHKAESLLSGAVNASASGLQTIAGGATQQITRSGISSVQAAHEAVKQTGLVTQQEGGIKGVLQGIRIAGSNLALSAAGSHSGHYCNFGTGMTRKTQTLQRDLAENQTNKIINQPVKPPQTQSQGSKL